MKRPLRILVAEDERDTREYLLEMLNRMGHESAGAETGRQLVELSQLTEPDLVLTDIKMPDMDGLEAAESINHNGREVPVVVVTAHHDPEFLRRAAASHVMAYLIKPVGPADVEAAVTIALARFEQYRQVRKEANDLKQALEDRKLIERAKGAIMKRLNVQEDEAFRRLRRVASDGNLRLSDAARRILTAEEVFAQMDD
jgi:response regulator NasT